MEGNMIKIPKQLKNCKFCRVQFKTKKPFEKDWTKKPYTYDEIQKYLGKENYGVMCDSNFRALDDDSPDKRLIKLFEDNFGKTFRSRDHLCIKFTNGEDKKIIFKDKEGNHYGELQGSGQMIVGAGSTHPSGEKYEVKYDTDIITIHFELFKEIFKDYIQESSFDYGDSKEMEEDDEKLINDFVEKWKEGNRQELALSLAGYLRKEKRYGFNRVKSILEEICKRSQDNEINMRLTAARDTFRKDEKEVKGYSGIKEIIPKKSLSSQIFTVLGQVEMFYDEHPYFYDKSGMFFLWNKEKFKYEISDEVDVLNGISNTGVDTISSKTKTEIINALKQFGRKMIPKESPKTWIQFKNLIYDFETGEVFEASPDYFMTNPIPWELGETEETPTIDNLFEEWVGEDYKKTLYQIISYCCSPEQFMQRLVALVGGGANGKGTFLKLLIKFLGSENVSSSELKELATSGFETSAIYKKLACIMGEISYDDLKNTNQIKKLAGEDQIRFCFKGKTPFSEESTTTLISATNSLPNTPDKTIGFYRKWLIIDFPNQFEIKQGILESIPEKEFKNLARRVVRELAELYKEQKFHNEGNFDERMVRYEERSNPLLRFIETNCEEVPDVHIELRKFANEFNEYAKNHHLRVMSVVQIGKALREEGFETGTRQVWCDNVNKVSKKVILNLRIKLKPLELPKIQRETPCNINLHSQ